MSFLTDPIKDEVVFRRRKYLIYAPFNRVLEVQRLFRENELPDLLKIQQALSELAKGKTVLMIAHRLSTVENADCIYVIADGEIQESGTCRKLCEQGGLFAKMWNNYKTSAQWKVEKEG